MTRDLVVGLDVSTTAAKAVVWDMGGHAVAEGRLSIPRASSHPGWGEQDPADWWRATVEALRRATAQVDGNRIAALSIAHQRESFACLDAEGEAVRPAILWLDTRATAEIVAHGDARVHEVTGKPPNTATSWYKLLWLQRHEPDAMARTRRVVDVQAYLVHRMTGRWRTSFGSADPMGLLDMRAFALDAELLRRVGLAAEQVPELSPSGVELGRLADGVATAAGLTPGLPVIAGIGDGQAAGLGAGITAPGAAYLNLGTGIVSGTFSADYRWGREFRTMCGAAPGTYMPETFIGGGTFNVSWFVDQFSDADVRPFGLQDSAERILEIAAEKVPAGSDGLLVLPYLSGALSPYWDSDARGVFLGLSAHHGRSHMYRALLEGLAMEQRLSTTGAEAALGVPIERLRVMGGGSRSPLWCQIVADVLGRPVEVTRETETTCLGAGMLAAVGAGLHASIADAAAAMSGTREVYRPHAPTASFYGDLYEVYRGLYPRLRDSFAHLQEVLKSRGAAGG
ncbi:xylulokinase [Lichenibacterium dinghuense]|uniref:xylulokinase n=1 Tax=Lichenibacterium dinghuense TaxID=2895977 RepID=UPI001F184014|nr:FGGY-family carbohydrate kinase [Lichenibacterium sp. 6Y81]